MTKKNSLCPVRWTNRRFTQTWTYGGSLNRGWYPKWSGVLATYSWKMLIVVSGRVHVQILSVAKTPFHFDPPLDILAAFPSMKDRACVVNYSYI